MTTMEDHRECDRRRVRWLRHIGDIEATLARRNERHERDQERIRELELEASELRESLLLNTGAKTAREHLKLAWEAAIAPEDGMIHAGEEYVLHGIGGRVEGPLRASKDRPHRPFAGTECRLLEPRTEPSEEEKRRKDYQDLGLTDWEIELLMESER